MKNIMRFSYEQDNSEIHKEAHKARITKGKLKKKASIESSENEMKIKIKPKCSK